MLYTEEPLYLKCIPVAVPVAFPLPPLEKIIPTPSLFVDGFTQATNVALDKEGIN